MDIKLHTEGPSIKRSVSPLAKIEKNVVWLGGQRNKSTNNLLVMVIYGTLLNDFKKENGGYGNESVYTNRDFSQAISKLQYELHNIQI